MEGHEDVRREAGAPGPGDAVQHYRLVRLLGSGGMGEVFLARDERLGREVAIKFLRTRGDGASIRRAREAALHEARAASGLKSSHLAAIYDIGEQDDRAFIVMEYAEGRLLSERLAAGAIDLRTAVDLAQQLADALYEAHSAGVIHRDIKSSNLLIDDRSRLKVLDFGIAKFADPDQFGASPTDALTVQHTNTGVIRGTFSYMSPEQALGRPVDHRTDLFAEGVVLYEMLAGRLPFRGATATEVIDQIVNHEPTPLARLNHGVPTGLEAIVRKCLAKQPDFRYQSARELFIDLHAVGRSLDSTDSTPESFLPTWQIGQLSAANRRAAEAVATGSSAPERLVAVLTFANLTGNPQDQWIGSGIAETVATDLEGTDGLQIISRARLFEVMRDLSTGVSRRFEDESAILVGRRVGASWIIGGAYQRAGDRIRITAHLLDVESGTLLKTVKVDGSLADIFTLQDRIVAELTRGLDVRPGGASPPGTERRSMQASEAYSHGLLHLRMATRESLDSAAALFEKALALDPRDPAVWTSLGAALHMKGMFLGTADVEHRANEALERALALDPDRPSAHYWRSQALAAIGRTDEALETARRGIALSPRAASGYAALGRVLWLGKGAIPEGIEALEQAATLDPASGDVFLQLGLLHAVVGSLDRAEAVARQALSLQEQALSGTEGRPIIGARVRLGYVYYRRGQYAEAIDHYREALEYLTSTNHALRDRTVIEATVKIGAAHYRLGDREQAAGHFTKALEAAEAESKRNGLDTATSYYVASAHALGGDADLAAPFLEPAVKGPFGFYRSRLALDPDFEEVRASPAIRNLLDGSRAAADSTVQPTDHQRTDP